MILTSPILSRDERLYVLNPKEVYGEDPSTETRQARPPAQGKFSGRDVPRAEGEGDQAVWDLHQRMRRFTSAASGGRGEHG